MYHTCICKSKTYLEVVSDENKDDDDGNSDGGGRDDSKCVFKLG